MKSIKYYSIYKQIGLYLYRTFKTKKFKKVKRLYCFLNYRLVANNPFKRNAMPSIFRWTKKDEVYSKKEWHLISRILKSNFF